MSLLILRIHMYKGRNRLERVALENNILIWNTLEEAKVGIQNVIMRGVSKQIMVKAGKYVLEIILKW